MRRYEMMIIIADTLEEDDAKSLFERAKSILVDQGGQIVDEAWWGKRRFAYEIDKRNHGFYGILDFEAEAAAVDETARQLKLRDDIVRLKTVRPELRVKKPA